MDNYLGDFKDVADEIKVDEPLLKTYMDDFWDAVLFARESLEDAINALMDSASENRPGEIRVNTEHFMELSSGVRNALREIKELEGERRV